MVALEVTTQGVDLATSTSSSTAARGVDLAKPKRSGWLARPLQASVRLNKLLRDRSKTEPNKSEPDKAVQVNDLVTGCDGVSPFALLLYPAFSRPPRPTWDDAGRL
jgi:hypothetical protein